jgi:hypothetical protein
VFWTPTNLREAMLWAGNPDHESNRLEAGLFEVTGVRWKQSVVIDRAARPDEHAGEHVDRERDVHEPGEGSDWGESRGSTRWTHQWFIDGR